MSLPTLKKEINRLTNGYLLILESISNVSNPEEQSILEDVFNGNTEEGYAQTSYAKLFSFSFEEEVSILQSFRDDFVQETPENLKTDANDSDDFPYFNMFDFTNEQKHILSMVVGLEISKDSLKNIVSLCKENPALRHHLLSFEGTEEVTNPFKQHGIVEFDKKFRGWSRAFLKEVKDEIGKRKIEKIKEEAKTLLFA